MKTVTETCRILPCPDGRSPSSQKTVFSSSVPSLKHAFQLVHFSCTSCPDVLLFSRSSLMGVHMHLNRGQLLLKQSACSCAHRLSQGHCPLVWPSWIWEQGGSETSCHIRCSHEMEELFICLYNQMRTCTGCCITEQTFIALLHVCM